MPVVIFCGGRGSRLKEETEIIPKPLVPIGERPILWHIMKMYYAQGFRRFILLLGYKGDKIKDYFCNYMLYASDFTLSPRAHAAKASFHRRPAEDWHITFVETGLDTQTGGRLRQIESYIKTPFFMLTYGDGVGDIDLKKLIATHREKKKLVTLTGVFPPSRFGEVLLENGDVVGFNEKPARTDVLVNSGFYVVDRSIFTSLRDDNSLNFEKEVLPSLAERRELAVHPHGGYWQCMDTIRDMEVLNAAWASSDAPWKVWA
ncbi:glucose-1-phosphate cytidylyltransferase [Candidatus Kaiserbacteria bacterium]|nr:glucose-1-phosphate cytidylyltransferase [Candidatus Kaiserbacteria bacterium]